MDEDTAITLAQHKTKALWALTLIGALLEVFGDVAASKGETGFMFQRVQRRHKVCQEFVKAKNGRISAGARRDLDARFKICGPFMETEGMTKEQNAERFAALWWTALSELISANVVCRNDICKGQAWAYLEEAVSDVANQILLPMFPSSDEAGTRISLMLP